MNYMLGFINVVVQIIFTLLIFIVLARFILQIVRADFRNPFSQMFVKATDPMLRPLRRFIPGLFGMDMAAIVLLMIIQFLELMITHLIRGIGLHNPLLFLVEAVGTLISHAAQLYMVCVFIVVIASWIAPGTYHPLVQIAYQVTNPIMRRCRKILPETAGIDFSPILALIFLFAIMFLIAAPLIDLPHRAF